MPDGTLVLAAGMTSPLGMGAVVESGAAQECAVRVGVALGDHRAVGVAERHFVQSVSGHLADLAYQAVDLVDADVFDHVDQHGQFRVFATFGFVAYL
ncbi:hypothetical protein ACTD5D_20505 [Nocardia takedensis]|uniref:hypothetical protein n=1 Tax=Nocardia takedensis TaxID=259390 RepID=UPI003F75FC91